MIRGGCREGDPNVIETGSGQSVPGGRDLVRKSITDEMRVYQDLGNSSDFRLGVPFPDFQLLRRATREGGAHAVSAAGQFYLAQ